MSVRRIVIVQCVFLGGLTAAWASLSPDVRTDLTAQLTGRSQPLVESFRPSAKQAAVIVPFYDDSEVVSDEELAAVLNKVLPRFSRSQLRPNYVEHALRIWKTDTEFVHPDLIDGPEMTQFLLDTGSYIASWGDEGNPILEPRPDGVEIEWGPYAEISVHHDHMLASLSEAGVQRDTPVITPAGKYTFLDVLNRGLIDFRVDERETEWSAMAFGLWLAPEGISEWRTSDHRRQSFDLIARRLMRNVCEHGVCLGTHRVYSLMVLIRLDDEFPETLSDEVRADAMGYLRNTRDLIIASQREDGAWPINWSLGAKAATTPVEDDDIHRVVIATGHHLEWLAIAPEELHPPRDDIRRAADWVIRQTVETEDAVIHAKYTFYSHVGNALSLWRKTTPAEFWINWRGAHPMRRIRLMIRGSDFRARSQSLLLRGIEWLWISDRRLRKEIGGGGRATSGGLRRGSAGSPLSCLDGNGRRERGSHWNFAAGS